MMSSTSQPRIFGLLGAGSKEQPVRRREAVMNPVEDPPNLEKRRRALYLTPVGKQFKTVTA
jgi:hypothetical protein